MGSMMAAQGGLNVVGGIGGVVSSAMAKSAAKKAGQIQQEGLKRIRAAIEKDLDPALIAEKAKQQDIQRAKDRLALQAEIDPELAKQRQVSQQMLSDQLAGIGTAESDRIAALAAEEGARGVPGMDAAKAELIDAALQELRLGAKLPPDVQAELMQAGLQQAGQVTGRATATPGGAGSVILSEVLGGAGLKLRADRQTQAAQLATAAGNLDAQRQQILQTLFPNLQKQQMGNIAAASGILQQSNQMLPQVGLSGPDISNLWLQRVGALNQINTQKLQANVNSYLAQQQARQNMWGTVTSAGQWKGGQEGNPGGGGGLGSDYASYFNMFGGGGGGGMGGGGGNDIMGIAAAGGGTTAGGFAVPSMG